MTGDAASPRSCAAAQPVTLEDLRLALDTLGPRLASDPNDSLWNRVRRMLGDLVVLRQADTPSAAARRAAAPRPAARSTAAMSRRRSPKSPTCPASRSPRSWTGAARRYVAARAGLAEIERAAMDVPPAARQTG